VTTIEDLDNDLPNGMHDAEIERIDIDYEARIGRLYLRIDFSDPSTEEQVDKYRSAVLILEGLQFLAVDPPSPGYPFAEACWSTEARGSLQRPQHRCHLSRRGRSCIGSSSTTGTASSGLRRWTHGLSGCPHIDRLSADPVVSEELCATNCAMQDCIATGPGLRLE
jgi:hypothetical protein